MRAGRLGKQKGGGVGARHLMGPPPDLQEAGVRVTDSLVTPSQNYSPWYPAGSCWTLPRHQWSSATMTSRKVRGRKVLESPNLK